VVSTAVVVVVASSDVEEATEVETSVVEVSSVVVSTDEITAEDKDTDSVDEVTAVSVDCVVDGRQGPA
jgi:hypothetical protein